MNLGEHEKWRKNKLLLLSAAQNFEFSTKRCIYEIFIWLSSRSKKKKCWEWDSEANFQFIIFKFSSSPPLHRLDKENRASRAQFFLSCLHWILIFNHQEVVSRGGRHRRRVECSGNDDAECWGAGKISIQCSFSYSHTPASSTSFPCEMSWTGNLQKKSSNRTILR